MIGDVEACSDNVRVMRKVNWGAVKCPMCADLELRLAGDPITVLDVGLKLDAEDYEDKEEYVQYSHCMHAYHYFLCQVYEKFSYWSHGLLTTAQETPSICTQNEENGMQAKVQEGIH